eukprot:SAG11_NODE_21768_length_419_cov_0.800000_1_plen_37_part_01
MFWLHLVSSAITVMVLCIIGCSVGGEALGQHSAVAAV